MNPSFSNSKTNFFWDTLYAEVYIVDIYQEGGQDSNHIVVGFQTSGWKSN